MTDSKEDRKEPKEKVKEVAGSESKPIIIKTYENPYYHTKLKFGQRVADAVTGFCGSWKFIIIIFIIMAIWMYMNIIMFFYHWDPYPFILLNFVLSCLAAVEAPIILMSQNRQSERDRSKTERDYLVNRKAEKEVANMQKDLDYIKKMLRKIVK